MEGALDYRGRKISTHNLKLMEFIRQLGAGGFLIPTFQRLFVWSAENITNLWDSIYKCYPIGSILCWRSHARLHVHRKLGGFYVPGNGSSGDKPHSYILDGQQRATSLLVSFYGGTGKVREQFSFDYTLYFDLKTAVFFFEKDYYRHRWEADPEFLVRLNDAPELPPDYCRELRGKPGYSPRVDKNLEQLRYVFTDYSIPLIYLEGFDIEGVCAIYERINQTGMRLKNMDILIARGFKNYATVVEEDFPITE
jgi:uncharacterized protein with ParB-like and HNH nuclease domain